MQRFETNITLHCRKCGEHSRIEVEVPELNFAGDKMSDHPWVWILRLKPCFRSRMGVQTEGKIDGGRFAPSLGRPSIFSEVR